MKEYIERAEVYQYLDNEVEWNVNQDRLYALEVISDFPAAEVAEVVRCRECKYYEVDAGWTDGRACLMHHHRTTACRPDDFCSRGERKEAAHEISE